LEISEQYSNNFKSVPELPFRHVPFKPVEQGPSPYHLKEYTEKEEKILELAEKRFRRTKKGLKSSHLVDIGFAKNDADARSKIKRCVAKNILFTFGHKRPQEYYPTILKAQVMSHLLPEIVPKDHSGVNHKLEELLQEVRLQSLEYILAQLPEAPLGIHNPHMFFSTTPEYYNDIDSTPLPRNRAKSFKKPIGKALVTCSVYPNGTVDIQIACNKNPFRLESEDDISNFVAYLGEVKAFVAIVLSDPRSRAIPDVMDWILTECDINKDVEVSNAFSLVSLHTQGNFRVRDYEYVLRTYFKLLGSKTVFRNEVTLAPRVQMGQILNLFSALAITFRTMPNFKSSEGNSS
jgi:hypothetical protein